MNPEARLGWIEPVGADLPLTRQCVLAGVTRATVYRRREAAMRQACETEKDLALRALIDEKYTERPFYGSRRMVKYLKSCGHVVNRNESHRVYRRPICLSQAALATSSNCL
jgi:putative transposase